MVFIEEFANQIAEVGTTDIFGIPGSGPSLKLINDLEKRGTRFHLTHFEGTAVLMAGAFGRIKDKAGVAIGIKGPGLANMVPGLATCALENYPVVSVSEGYLPHIPSSKAHKRLNHQKLLSAIVKGQGFLGKNGSSYSELSTWAEYEIPGPVHINISDKPAEKGLRAPVYESLEDSHMYLECIELLKRSERPIVIAGTLAVRRGWQNYLNLLSIPVFSTAAAKGVVDETKSHSAGVYTGIGGELTVEREIIDTADLIIGLGLRHREVLNVPRYTKHAIFLDPACKEENFGFSPDFILAGSKPQIEELIQLLKEKDWGTERLRRSEDRLMRTLYSRGFLPGQVFTTVQRAFGVEARLVLDTGNFCTIGEHVWRVSHPNLYIASAQGRCMGVGLPLAIGASIADASVPTILFTGDGGIGMYVAEAKLAADIGLPLLIVLLSDGYLGTIRGSAFDKGLSQRPTIISNPSWRDAMEGLGIEAITIEKESDLFDSISRWERHSPLFVEVAFNPEEYQKMTEGIR